MKSSQLPLVSHCASEESCKILLESEWNILTTSAGDGHIVMDLDDSGVLNDLVEMGVEYVHVRISPLLM
jgi:UDP-N-acetylglucosamine pyrophosphorylase